MSAIAIVLAEMGHRVSGSDLRERPVLERVRAAGVEVHVGHDRRHVARLRGGHCIDCRAREQRRARRRPRSRALPVLTRAGMLSSICAQAKSLGVAGTHGKTTTTSMLMLILSAAGLRPSFIIGGDVTDMGTGAQWTGGEWLVVEADESDGTHLELPLFGTILTNVEVDHLDFYGTEEAIVAGFDQYLAQIAGPKVLCIDDPVCAELAGRHGAITYGTSSAADFRAVDIQCRSRLVQLHRPTRPERHSAPSICRCAVSTTCATHWVPWRWLAPSVSTSTSPLGHWPSSAASPGGSTSAASTAARRSSTTTPTCRARSSAVLSAARGSGDGWRRVVAVFQPNRFNRMAVMSPAYRDAFVDADLVVITDIYPSGTTPIPGVTGKLVVNAVLDAHPTTRLAWMPRRSGSDRLPRRGTARRRRLHLDGLRRHRLVSRRGAAAPRRADRRVRLNITDRLRLRRPSSGRVSATHLFVTDIYHCSTDPHVTGTCRQRRARRPPSTLAWMPRRRSVDTSPELRDGDVCISMGCGDIASLPDEVQQRRAELRVPSSR